MGTGARIKFIAIFRGVEWRSMCAKSFCSASYVQGADATPQTPQTTVSVPYTAAQNAGNLNVVIVGWNDTTAQFSSVTDTKGNVYQLAVGPTQLSGALSQSIYYAKNIAAAAAGANTVKGAIRVSGAVCRHPGLGV